MVEDWYLPLGHASHAPVALLAQRPALQSKQCAPASAALVAPGEPAKMPLHVTSMHAADPVPLEYLPAGHVKHAVLLASGV